MKQLSASYTYYFFFLSLSASLFSYFLSAVFLGISFFLSFFLKSTKNLTSKELWFFAFLLFPYVVILVSGAQSMFLDNYYSILTRNTPLLVSPYILFKLNYLDQKKITAFKIILTLSVVFVAIEGIIKGFVFYFNAGDFFPHYSFSHIFRIQHTYLVLYLLFCCIIWFFGEQRKTNLSKMGFVLLCLLTIAVTLLVKARFGGVFILLFCLIYVLRTQNRLMLLFSALIIGISTFLLGDKFLTVFSGNESRLLFWRCSVSLTDLTSILKGIPAGDLQEMLNTCYYNETMKLGYENKNTHNQHLFFFMTGGILAFLGHLFLYIKGFFQDKTKTFKASLLLIFIMSLTENIFERQHGILFICIAIGTTYYLKKKT